jgi:hypothetical protein
MVTKKPRIFPIKNYFNVPTPLLLKNMEIMPIRN